MTEVLLDNFTLQGAYCFLKRGHTSSLYEACLAHLVESIVIYDTLFVPQDVLDLNNSCQEVVNLFGNIIVGKINQQTPHFRHHLVDYEMVTERIRPFIEKHRPFSAFENNPDVYQIEQEGLRQGWHLPGCTKYQEEPTLSFAERHTYYTWYCVRLAAALGTNYAPNPTRKSLFENPYFLKFPHFPSFERQLLDYFQDVRSKYAKSMAKVFPPVSHGFEIPLVYNYVKASSKSPQDIPAETLKLRNSQEAQAFRKLGSELEEAMQKGDITKLDKVKNEVKSLGERWSKTISTQKSTKKWTVFWMIGGTDFKTRWFSFNAVDRKPHFVFLHELVTAFPPNPTIWPVPPVRKRNKPKNRQKPRTKTLDFDRETESYLAEIIAQENITSEEGV